MAEKKLKISIFELVAYIVIGLFSLWGVVYIFLGMSCSFISTSSAVYLADGKLRSTTNNMGFLSQGILILSIGIIVGVIILLIFAKKADRDFEKNQRRAARIAARKEEMNVVDVDSEAAK